MDWVWVPPSFGDVWGNGIPFISGVLEREKWRGGLVPQILLTGFISPCSTQSSSAAGLFLTCVFSFISLAAFSSLSGLEIRAGVGISEIWSFLTCPQIPAPSLQVFMASSDVFCGQRKNQSRMLCSFSRCLNSECSAWLPELCHLFFMCEGSPKEWSCEQAGQKVDAFT